MQMINIPIIVVCCYIIGEIYKYIFKKNKETYKLIPVVMAISGAIISILIYFTNKEILESVNNIWEAILIGVISGTSSTGANQIIKQIFKIKGEKNE